jgi:methylated-DNA-[protein]-cysteine S-methyltransferase
VEQTKKISIQYFKTYYGELILGSIDDKLCLCDWRYRKMRPSIDQRIQRGLNASYQEELTSVIKETISQLEAYFTGHREQFEIPLKLIGSDFKKSVWNELLKIPFGQTETYLGLSKKLDDPKAIRAVASANGANAISIIVPCHRIIGTSGKLIGYAGGLSAKRDLLLHESKGQLNDQLQLF